MFTLGRRFFASLGFIVREATRTMYPTIQSLGGVECGSIQGLEGVESCFQVSFEYFLIDFKAILPFFCYRLRNGHLWIEVKNKIKNRSAWNNFYFLKLNGSGYIISHVSHKNMESKLYYRPSMLYFVPGLTFCTCWVRHFINM